jgi:hypothetical protein
MGGSCRIELLDHAFQGVILSLSPPPGAGA